MKGVKTVYNLWLEFETKEERLRDLKKIENPKNLNEAFFNLQYDYIVNDDEKAFVSLWQEFTKLCFRILKKEARKKGLWFDVDTLNYKADIACEYVMRRYKKYLIDKNEFYIIRNFVSEAYDSVKHAMSREETDVILDNAENIEDLTEWQ